MNQDQKKYLLKRLDEIKETKRRQLLSSIASIDVVSLLKKLQPRLTFQMEINKVTKKLSKRLLLEKKLPNKNSYNPIFSLSESELFANFATIKKQYEEKEKERKALCDKKESKLRDYVINLKDEIMLGDSKKALEQLAQFEKMKF